MWWKTSGLSRQLFPAHKRLVSTRLHLSASSKKTVKAWPVLVMISRFLETTPYLFSSAKDGDDMDFADGEDDPSNRVGSDDGYMEIVADDMMEESNFMDDGGLGDEYLSSTFLSCKSFSDIVDNSIEMTSKSTTQRMDCASTRPNHSNQARLDSNLSTLYKTIDFYQLEAAIGYQFKSRSLLVQAFTHASHLRLGKSSYKRLEFAGDSVLNSLVTHYFVKTYRDLSPGCLTKLRQLTVSNENFARITVKHNLHLHLQHESADLQRQIENFVGIIQNELDEPGLNSFGFGEVKAPKVLADILEAIAGAVYEDTGSVAEKVWQVFEPLLQPMVTPETTLEHPISELQVWCQQHGASLEYRTSEHGKSAFLVEVFVDGDRISYAQNKKKKTAQRLAAQSAVQLLKERQLDLRDSVKEINYNTFETEFANTNFSPANFGDVGPNRSCQQVLYEGCLAQKWLKPEYKVEMESGPPHDKQYVYSVRISNRENGWSTEAVGDPMPRLQKAKESAAEKMLGALKGSIIYKSSDLHVPT